ncbi:forkhead box J2 [Fusarium beomiforme]|uniref:Forkhead box J2 n=1 Tax=Fusarium beomiforme TaxID=44412 RepID=A0A9P5A7U4_9HYPO|nr:forkhead box J2 [Fusarium beomiforme]
MTSSIAGLNGLQNSLGADRETQAVASRTVTTTSTDTEAQPQTATSPAAMPSNATLTTSATKINATSHSPTNNDDKRDSKVADTAPVKVPAPALSASAPMQTSNPNPNPNGNSVAVSSSSTEAKTVDPLKSASTSTSTPPSTATVPPAFALPPIVPLNPSLEENSAAPAPKASTSNRESAYSASMKVADFQPPPSTPPPIQGVLSAPATAANATTSTSRQQPEASSNTEASAPVNVNSGDHPMPDASTPRDEAATSTIDQAQQPTPLQLQMPAENMGEHFAPSTPYAASTMPTINQHAYMMMALATMSGASTAMSPPPTVTPAQVTLPNPLDESFQGLAPTNSTLQTDSHKALESFARIEFADSVFQMTTYAVIIGRDQRALEQARRDERRAEEYRRRAEENSHLGLPPPSPIQPDRSKFSKSYVSEEGGMLGPESDTGENPRPSKRRKTSTQGSSQHDLDEAAAQAQENMISNRQYVSHTPGAAAVDLGSLRPSPYHVPFIGIHSPGPNIASKTKAISREHLKIAYNQELGVFEAIPLHKNGFFCEDVHYNREKLVLRCGDRLQIKDVDFRFLINGVERGRTGAEEDVEEEPAVALKKRHAQGGKEMSFDFESAHGNGEIQDTSDELSDVASPPESPDFGDGDEDDAEAEAEETAAMQTVETEPEKAAKVEADIEEEEEAEADGEMDAEMDMEMDMDMDIDEMTIPGAESALKQEGMLDPHQEHLMPQIPKKRGPGRPPKNGFMSKREQRLLKKQQQEMAKKTLPQAPTVEPPIKRKVGRPRKHPLPEGSSERPEKRKYKPRKPREDGAEGSDAERRAREKKEKKARPKSPPLELKIEDYTEEQLQKPNKNYGVLIDETLTAAGPDGLTLKQIYKRICLRYPWFYFHTETKGWESSVRHNLIGNEAFRKDETTNLWSRVPGVELDAGKKRKASSPDRAAAHAYGQYQAPYAYNTQHMAPGAPGYPPGQAPPGYQMPTYAAPQIQPGRPAQPYGASASPPAPGQPGPATVASQPPAPAQLPPGYGPPPAPARPQLGVPQQGTYSSPYAPRPPPPANTPIKSEEGHANAAAVSAGASLAQKQQHLPPLPPAAVAAKTVPGTGPSPALQQPATPVNRTPSVPAASVPARPAIDPKLLAAVVKLKSGLIDNLKKARNPKAEGIVMSALNRCIGLKKEATENDKMETICMKGIRQVVDAYIKSKSPTPGPVSSASPAAETLPFLDTKVLASINGFKDVSVKALNPKLGEAKAEAVTLSAIDRVLGIADASIVPPPGEGEAVGNFEGIEQHLMKSIRQLLTGMNQKV